MFGCFGFLTEDKKFSINYFYYTIRLYKYIYIYISCLSHYTRRILASLCILTLLFQKFNQPTIESS